jgi:hypothetical protein
MPSKEFSRSVWETLEGYAASLSSPKKFISLADQIGTSFPCEHCQKHYLQFRKTYPPEAFITDRLTAQIWIYCLRDSINQRREKLSPPFEVVRKRTKEGVRMCPSCKVY